MHLGLFVCMSVRTSNSKTIAPIDLIFLHKKYYPLWPPKMIQVRIRIGTREYILKILCHWEIG